MITALEGYPFDQMTERFDFRADVPATGRSSWTRSRSNTTRRSSTRTSGPTPLTPPMQYVGFEASHYQLDGPAPDVQRAGHPSLEAARRSDQSRRSGCCAAACSARATH